MTASLNMFRSDASVTISAIFCDQGPIPEASQHYARTLRPKSSASALNLATLSVSSLHPIPCRAKELVKRWWELRKDRPGACLLASGLGFCVFSALSCACSCNILVSSVLQVCMEWLPVSPFFWSVYLEQHL